MEPTPPSRYRRLLTLVVALGLCGAVMGWVTLHFIKERLVASTGESLALVAVSIADKLDMLLMERYGDIRVLATDARRLLGDEPALSAHLAHVAEAYPVYSWLVVTDPSGRVVAATGTIARGADERDQEWFAAVQRDPATFVHEALTPDGQGGTPLVVFARSIRDEQDRLLGAVAGGANLDAMNLTAVGTSRAFASASNPRETVALQILTREGRVFFDSRGFLHPQAPAASGLPSAGALARGEFGWIEESPLRDAGPVITGFAPTRGRGEFRGLGCGVLVQLDRGEVLAVVNQVLWRTGLTGGAVVLPLIALLAWSVRRLRMDWVRLADSEAHLARTLRATQEAESKRLETARRLEKQNAALAEQARNRTLRGRDLQASFQTITEVAARTLDTARVSIWLYAEDRAAIRSADLFEQATGSHSAGAELRLEEFPRYFAALAENRVIAAQDARTDPRTCEFRAAYLEPLAITSMLDALIRSGDTIVGVVCHEHIGPPREWTWDEQNFAGSMADLVALSIEVHQRHQAEAALQSARAQLELRVAERTAALSQANAALQGEVVAHRYAADQLRVFRRFAETAGQGFAMATLDGHMTYLNPALCQMLGEDAPDRLVGKSFSQFYTEPDKVRLEMEVIPTVMREGEWVGELSLISSGGEITPTIDTVFLIRDEAERPICLANLITDITERKRVETALARARDAALEADRLKSEFLAMMSHELRTPLNSIIGFTSILREEIVGSLNEEQKKQLGMVHSSAHHLLGLINDLLDLSRIESGKMEVFVEKFRLADVVSEVTRVLAPAVRTRNLNLQTKLHDPEIEVQSDRKKVYQVLLNLVGNAVKFTEKGSVTIISQSSVHSVILEVVDTGIGISPEQLANLFQAFRQADGSSRRLYEGTGLGLYLCKKLLALLGGSISAQSQVGIGSRFRFDIPIQRHP